MLPQLFKVITEVMLYVEYIVNKRELCALFRNFAGSGMLKNYGDKLLLSSSQIIEPLNNVVSIEQYFV